MTCLEAKPVGVCAAARGRSLATPTESLQRVNVEKGAVWKFGKTVDASGRYTDSYLDSIGPGVILETEFEGTVDEALKVEQMKIDNYVQDPGGSGELPPGNKVRR